MARPYQRNAADPKQIKGAERLERRRAERLTASLRAVMGTPEGRLVMWELLAKAGVFQSIWDPSARIHYNAGRQDYGHELLALLLVADEELYLRMEREMRAWQRSQDNEAAAVQTPAATEGESN